MDTYLLSLKTAGFIGNIHKSMEVNWGQDDGYILKVATINNIH